MGWDERQREERQRRRHLFSIPWLCRGQVLKAEGIATQRRVYDMIPHDMAFHPINSQRELSLASMLL